MVRHYISVNIKGSFGDRQLMNTVCTLTLRLPADLKAFIQAEMKENGSSQNSEIVRAIRERMKSRGMTRAPNATRQIDGAHCPRRSPSFLCVQGHIGRRTRHQRVNG